MDRHSNYREKYLKYKSKYMELKKFSENGPTYNMKGGAITLLPVESIEQIHDESKPTEEFRSYEQFTDACKLLTGEPLTSHKESLKSCDKNMLTLESNELFKSIHYNAKLIAINEGMRLYKRWVKDRSKLIGEILSNFDDNGDVLSEKLEEPDNFFNSATWFNDLYKWTMYSVMRFIEKQEKFGGQPIHVKFQVDIREPSVRNALKDPVLQGKVFQALEKLKTRTFEKDIFEQVSKEKGDIISAEDIDAICLKDGVKRHLVQEVSFLQNALVPEDGVVIRSFYKDELYYDVPKEKDDGTLEQVGEPGLLIIEAEGPWHLVTWLETAMMQCVYEAYHKHILDENKVAYSAWLSKALLRCATSVAYTRIMQHLGGPTPALFTGRRTGGLLFLILQNLFFIDHFKQFVPPKVENGKLTQQPAIATIGLYSDDEGTACLGTSSVDAALYLRTLLSKEKKRESMKKTVTPNVLSTVGTHAHELSMVLSSLYFELDENPLQLPFSQVLGHYLYEELVRKKTLGPLPMLSDTLGTPAFVLAASLLLFNDCIFLSFINSARQDSGDLVDFETILNLVGYKGGCMASEIDDTVTLLKASLLEKFNTFGAGGFFGDSNKVFSKSGVNISMAVKVVRVEYAYNQVPINASILPPNVIITPKEDGTMMCIGYPVKTGDPNDVLDESGRQQISKFSADKTLGDSEDGIKRLLAMRNNAITTRENATTMLLSPNLFSGVKQQVCRGVFKVSGDDLIIDTKPLDALVPVFELAEQPVVPIEVGGGKSKRSTRR